jgi:hypothetical protein
MMTPFRELLDVLRLRVKFDSFVSGLGDITEVVKANLFSNNRRIIEAIRQYRPYAESFTAALSEWPELLNDVPLSRAPDLIELRVNAVQQLAQKVRELGIAHISVPFEILRRASEWRAQVREIEASIAANPVLKALGPETWQITDSRQRLREAAELHKP